MTQLILSLFPGIGLLDMAFEEEGFCVVRGPDLIWGGDIYTFHPPKSRFDGIVGGPPCQCFSRLVHMVRHRYGDAVIKPNLIPEFERCVTEAQPNWFLMENVPEAPAPMVEGYAISRMMLNNRWVGGEQNRVRSFTFGVKGQEPVELAGHLDVVALEAYEYRPAVLASGGSRKCVAEGLPKTFRLRQMGNKDRNSLRDAIRYQGLPDDYLAHAPFTVKGKLQAIGNGVPLPMGRAIAQAVHRVVNGPPIGISTLNEVNNGQKP